MKQIIVSFSREELTEFTATLGEGKEVKLVLPASETESLHWKIYFRVNAPAAKAQHARPDEKNAVGMVNLNKELGEKLLEKLKELAAGGSTELLLSSLGALGTFQNLDVLFRRI